MEFAGGSKEAAKADLKNNVTTIAIYCAILRIGTWAYKALVGDAKPFDFDALVPQSS